MKRLIIRTIYGAICGCLISKALRGWFMPMSEIEIFQGSNVRKSSEAQNLYIALNVKVIVNDENYSLLY